MLIWASFASRQLSRGYGPPHFYDIQQIQQIIAADCCEKNEDRRNQTHDQQYNCPISYRKERNTSELRMLVAWTWVLASSSGKG